jgi:polar amino acid transport system ATP-binding protein/sulfate transport system ATP-binding protein
MGLLKRFGLGSHAKRYPVQLSGGQRQRVAIAQQLLCSDHFLLMDEPFSGLDPLMVDEVVRLITEVGSMDEENTIIVVTHDIPAAISVADTLWLMGRERDEQGNIIPGARIVSTYDLIERGLAWQTNVTQLPEFAQCVREVRDRFRQL